MAIFSNSIMTNLLKSSLINSKPLSNIILTTMNFAVDGAALVSNDLPDYIRNEKPGLKDGRYRCKIQQPELYKLVRELTDRFFTEECLRESHHMFDSQANEALNIMISKFATKNRVYCRTPSLQARVVMAVSIHSIGVEEFIDRVGRKSGFSPLNFSSRQFLQKRDKEKAYIGEYQKCIDVKGRRSKA
jgi:hypothetical protein